MTIAASGDWRGRESVGSRWCRLESRRATELRWSNVCPVVSMPKLVEPLEAQAGRRVVCNSSF